MFWQLNQLVSLQWRCWDDEFVVFDVGSGETHQLNPITAATLMMLELSPADMDELISRVSHELMLAPDEQLRIAVNEAVHGLQIAGLIVLVS